MLKNHSDVEDMDLTTDAEDRTDMYVSWDSYRRTVEDLSLAVQHKLMIEGSHVEMILAISRGGLLPAMLMAYTLGVGRVETIGVRSYDAGSRKKPMLVKAPAWPLPSAAEGTVLLVDGIADTGATLSFVHDVITSRSEHDPVKLLTVAAIAKPLAQGCLDIYGQMVPQNAWIYMPWKED